MYIITDLCEPCPSNAECYQGMMECVRGYRKHGKLCIEDGDINETAKKLANRIETHVCEGYAQFLCDGTGSVWVQEDEVWNDVDELKMMENLGLENAIDMHTKQRAMEMIDGLLETEINHRGIKELKCPNLLAEHYKPFSCRVQQWISNHALVLMPICGLLVGSILLLRRIRQRRNLSARAEELYNQICDILEENAMMTKGGNGEGEPWVVVSWLRDHLLLPKERKDPLLWRKKHMLRDVARGMPKHLEDVLSQHPKARTCLGKLGPAGQVEELVQEDSRLDRYPKLVKGESKVVWEWQVEGSLSSRLRKKREASKLKPSGGTNINSGVQSPAMKASEMVNC
ncbi:hypothetical protein CK203_017133 [Vitis vinifera]|uniref:Man1/Src1-like C-terminal domain-containing protein n=1 Tax=Vitis vinifera TaxID=29760 RepID=A0A438JZR4_VITVI|nr:hypothetical protein CK203_017133 [Vitis vinifera]